MSFRKKIAEARKIAQVPRTAEGEHWYSAYFVRYFSIYFSYFLDKLHVPANAVTVAMGIVGLCGAVCLVFNNLWWNIAGTILLHMWFFLDVVDGEVARLKGRTYLLGIYLDRLTHIIVNPTFVLALGLRVYLKEPCIVNLVAMIAVYSAWHWKRRVGLLVASTLMKHGARTGESVKTTWTKKKHSYRYYLVLALLKCFGDLEGMVIVSGLILASYVTQYDAAKWGLYAYTVLLLLYIGLLIIRDVWRMGKLDSKRWLHSGHDKDGNERL
jgi:phosphatidylglycerophosphate synthase